MSDSILSTSTPGTPSGGGLKIPILFGAILALIGASVYQFYQLNQVRTELADTREQLLDQISKVHETSTVSTQTNKRSVDALKQDVDEARRQASLLAGEAKTAATKHADELAADLKKAQAEQAQRVSAVATEVTAVKEDASSTKTRVGEVSADVANVKVEAAATRSELEKTIADLKSTRGDLGVQSGLIATNSKELAALRALGERNYTEFKLAKEKTTRKVGDIQIRLKSADPKKNRYTIEVVADDKLVEKKDKTINEPVQFLLARATQPYELVVNEVKKDMISGYLAAPKVQVPRGKGE
jgi:chromosome segregation ATPase